MTLANQFAPIWNSSGVNYNAIRANVTDIASSGGSTLLDLRVNDSGVFSVNKTGAVTFAGNSLQGLLDGKLSLAGGTLTGAVTSNVGTVTSSTPALTINQTWNNAAATFSLLSATLSNTASNNDSYWVNFQGSDFWGGNNTPVFRVQGFNGQITVCGKWGDGSIRLGGQSIGCLITAVYGTGLTFAVQGSTNFTIGTHGQYGNNSIFGNWHVNNSLAFTGSGFAGYISWDASNVLALKNSTNAQTFRLYGTFTDTSNYRRLYVTSTTAGAFTIGVEGAGTGASGNTLNVANSIKMPNQYSGLTTGAYGGLTLSGGARHWLLGAGYPEAFVFQCATTINPYHLFHIFMPNEGQAGSSFRLTGDMIFGWYNGNPNATNSNSLDISLARNAVGQLDIRGDSGLRVRNLANSADAPITASNGTFSGALSAVTKSFLIDHPTKPGRKLQYGSLESPYHGIRLTGRSFVEGGIGVIELPDYVRAFVSDDVNIQLTPVGRNILWVHCIDLNNNLVIVGGDLDGDFYWSFTGIRTDVELEVEPWA